MDDDWRKVVIAELSKNKERLNSFYIKMTIIILLVTTWVCPYNSRQYMAQGVKSFGIPFAYLAFPDHVIKDSLWGSTGINLLFLYLDFAIIYNIVKYVGKLINKIWKESSTD